MNKEEALKIYATEGATAAASAAGVTTRTIRRWGAAAGINSGYVAEPTVPCPSVAAYARGCRCDGCRDANRVRQAEGNADRKKRLASGQTSVIHGRVSTYGNWSCRCGECSAAWSAYLRQKKNGPKGP